MSSVSILAEERLDRLERVSLKLAKAVNQLSIAMTVARAASSPEDESVSEHLDEVSHALNEVVDMLADRN